MILFNAHNTMPTFSSLDTGTNAENELIQVIINSGLEACFMVLGVMQTATLQKMDNIFMKVTPKKT